MRMEGKVALVTGGNSGIGRGIVHRFVAEGAVVALVGRDRAKGDAVLAELAELGPRGKEAAFFACDLAEEAAVAALLAEIAARFARLDVLVNNAGVGSSRGGVAPEDPPGARWDKLRGPNLDAAYYVSSYARRCSPRRGALRSSTSPRPPSATATGASTASPRPGSRR